MKHILNPNPSALARPDGDRRGIPTPASMQPGTVPPSVPAALVCPECDGEGGWQRDEGRAVRHSYDFELGEVYLSNWCECDDCDGTGEIEAEEA